MNKYLLLRDNKQLGPYSVNELATHGLKPYDLVWLEGKSAAWRYPSEIDELRPFAPVVEEQPFDRFYKKTESNTAANFVQEHTPSKGKVQPIKENDKFSGIEKPSSDVKASGAKKIHVSLPGSKSEQILTDQSGAEKASTYIPRVSGVAELHKAPTGPVSPQNPATIGSHKINLLSGSTGSLGETIEDTRQKGPTLYIPKDQVPVSKLLFRTVVAACLLLGGAFIGLIINYNNQQKKFQQLNQLVQEIKQHDNAVTALPVKKEIIPKTEPAVTTELNDVTPSNETPVYKENIQLPVAKKSAREKKPAESTNAGQNAEAGESTPQSIPIVLNHDEDQQKAEKASSELARKNLWQLVSVQHSPFKTGVLGGISNLEMKITNKSLYQLEQVEIEIRYLNPEKKVVNKQTVIFENVPPGDQLSLSIPKSSRGVKIDYTIKKISTKELGLAHAGM